MPFQYKHLVIVHGIGDEKANETSIGFINEFARALPESIRSTLEIHNLVEGAAATAGTMHPAYLTLDYGGRSYAIGFSEVYWQPITNGYLAAHDGEPDIPVFTWAHSINTRLFQGGRRYQLAREAIDNLESMLGLIRRLAAIYKKSGILADVLNKFLCDVQMYVENESLRNQINQCFMDVMAKVSPMRALIQTLLRQTLNGLDIYVVSHSEGTVVAYNTLVEAARDRESNPAAHSWLPFVRALVTLGSPLDKHYCIWSNRFPTVVLTKDPVEPKIIWRNYWDRSDPVGYGLQVLYPPNTASDAARMFQVVHDSAFTRYPIPGKAHVDYWTDRDIHADILHEILTGGPNQSRVTDRWWRFLQAPVDHVAYLLGRVLTLAAILFFLDRTMSPLHRITPLAWLSAIPGFPGDGKATWEVIPWILLPPMVMKLLIEGQRTWQSRAVHVTLQILAALWMIVVALLALAVTSFDVTGIQIKDWIGYVTGLVVSILAWKLHSTIHNGLIQMWRYTGGEDTGYRPT